LRENLLNGRSGTPLLDRCIQRNPTKGIESGVRPSSPRHTILAWVAFKEIPQRELRDGKNMVVKPSVTAVGVAFKEIPQRELRAKIIVADYDGRMIAYVAFKEIPQRELRDL
jgi:hypothetical protein